MTILRYCVAGLILSSAPGILQAQIGGGGGGFGGPSVLGRAGASGGGRGEAASITVFAGANGSYDSGLSAVARDANGNFQQRNLSGLELSWGAIGAKNFRRSSLALNYQGDYRQTGASSLPNGVGNWNGSNQILGLTAATQVSRRVEAGVTISAGTSNRAFGGFAAPGPIDNGFIDSVSPVTSLFDNRVYFYNGIGQLAFQKGPRHSFSIGGGGFAVRRRDHLISVDGATARADWNYRLTRRQTIGVEYQYVTFQYPRLFGDAHMHGVAGLYALQFGRRWQLQMQAGVFRVETLGQRLVAVDPLIAEITGVTRAAEVSHTRNILPMGTLALMKSMRRGAFSAAVSIGANPGNGLLLTSQQRTANVGYTRQLSSRWTAGIRGNYFESRGIGFIAGQFRSYSGGVNIGFKISRTLQFNANVDRRVALLNAAQSIGNNGTRATAGIFWSPSPIPISLW